MLEARSVAVVGASSRPGSLGQRMVGEVLRSPGAEKVWLVNPGYPDVAGRPCLPDLHALDEAPDLVLLGVGDQRLVEQLSRRGGRRRARGGRLRERPRRRRTRGAAADRR